MQHAKATFTGRARRTRPHPWVKLGDALARGLITLGGIGTIVAVLLVGVFLLAVAFPLFLPAASRQSRTLAVNPPGSRPAVLAADETGSVVLAVQTALGQGGDVAAAEPGLRLLATREGRTLVRRPLADCGLAGATAIRVLPGSGVAAVGYADGSLRIGRIVIESAFIPAAAVPAAAAALEPEGVVGVGDGAIVRLANGRHVRVAPVVELGPESRPFDRGIVDVDVTQLTDGPLVAALDTTGRVRVETITSRRNLLTDELTTTSSGAVIDAEAGFTPSFVRVTELGDQLFLIAADGTGRRYEIRDVESPRLRESFAATVAPARVSAVERLFGGAAIAVGDDRGDVRVLFTTRGASATTADGLVTHVAKTFPATGRGHAAVTAIAGSPRSRLFAVADAAGAIRLLQATTGGEVLRFSLDGSGAGPSQPALAIAPRENRLLAAGGSGLAVWTLDLGHPDVSARTLFRPVWYENYPRAVHAWETTGHESFESKFGLVPLVFGTIKATVFSMLFATPIAILAAIYASQFLHPRWKARIKPTIEMMASLPSVVLGFVAGLVLAPLIERGLMRFVTGFLTVPLVLLAAAHLWQLLPSGVRGRLAPWRFPFVGLVALPAGVALAIGAAPLVEGVLFQGDFRGWLDGRGGSGFGGWMLALLPVSAIGAATIAGRVVSPWLREQGAGWSPRGASLVSLGVFAGGVLTTLAIAAAGSMFFDALRLDVRGGLLGTYVQRNAMVVAIGMSFAIIPLVFTIADDALSSVPDHLRSASLGAGATPWQTAIRVIVPAAASGLFSAVMIGLGRAVGETMIVLMAAGNTPLIGWNVFNGFQTLSAALATELPEAARGSTHYRVLFLAALTLFAMTFVVNTAAELVRQRFRRRSHEL